MMGMICPICHEDTDMRDMGYTHARHIFICKKCGQWLEEVKVLRPLTKENKQLIQALEV